MRFSLLDKYHAWRKARSQATHTQPAHAPAESASSHKERADAYLQKMAETLLSIEKTSTQRAVHEHEKPLENHPEHHVHEVRQIEERHEVLLPHHDEPKQLEDHHKETAMQTNPDLHARATNAFHAQNGEVYWTLSDLGDALVHMNTETFTHHAQSGRNDFASWIEGCFSGAEQAFAERLRGEDREGMVRAFLHAKGMPERAETAHKEPVVVEIPVDEPARETIIETAPETPVQHHEEKAPLHDFKPLPEHREPRSDIVKQIVNGLNDAHANAKKDLAAAREQFIALRTRVFSELTDDERSQVLPTLRHTYEYLRHAH